MSLFLALTIAVAAPVSDGQRLHDDMLRKEGEWRECVAKEARTLAAKSREPAETIATAALSQCPNEAWSFRMAGRRRAAGLQLNTDMGDAVVDRAMADWRGSLLAIIIKSR